MTEEELVSAIDQELNGALGSDSSKLSGQRTKAMEYYLGEPFGNEKPDRANVVTREVLDTIEWIKPELMKLFASGSETVRFEPEGQDDVEAAQQATDYINYLFHRKNPGFKILYQWITDGLLQKNGTVKAWWDDSATKSREEYKGLSETELMALAQRDDVELVSQDSYPDPQSVKQKMAAVEQLSEMMGQDPQVDMQIQQQLMQLEQTEVPQVYDVAIIVTGAYSGLKIEVIPPEEFLISPRAKDITSSPFCAHQREMTVSDLRAMGYEDLDDLPSGDPGVFLSEERRARHSYDDTDETLAHENNDPTMREVWVTEAYIRYDYDDDGIAELRKVVKVGDRVLENEMVDCMPFAGWTPIIVSHKFHGLSVADLIMDLQRIQSQLFRNLLDNQYLTNNGRYEAVEGMVNLDDLMTSRPHGIVRTKMLGAVKRLDTPQLSQSAFQMLGYVDQLRERRTGVSERTQGLDPNQLSANTAASAVNQVMTAAQQRIELIARVFGETGLTDLFRLMYKFVIQNQTSQDIFRLRDKYIEVDPTEWRERKDTSVVVGLGNGSRESEMLQLNMIFQNQMMLMQSPQTAQIVQPVNIYNTLEDQVKVFNKAASGRHFSDPTSEEAMQRAQQAQQQQMEQMQQQQKMLEMQQQLAQMEIQIKQFKAQSDDENKKAEIAIKRDTLGHKEDAHDDDIALRTASLEAEIRLEEEQDRGVSLG